MRRRLGQGDAGLRCEHRQQSIIGFHPRFNRRFDRRFHRHVAHPVDLQRLLQGIVDGVQHEQDEAAAVARTVGLAERAVVIVLSLLDDGLDRKEQCISAKSAPSHGWVVGGGG